MLLQYCDAVANFGTTAGQDSIGGGRITGSLATVVKKLRNAENENQVDFLSYSFFLYLRLFRLNVLLPITQKTLLCIFKTVNFVSRTLDQCELQ